MTHGRSRSEAQDARTTGSLAAAEPGNARGRTLSLRTLAGAGLVSYDADTTMNIASASKWLYGAYVAERQRQRLAVIGRGILSSQLCSSFNKMELN